jgi:tetratricopeptide (TPR) repeat protein
VRKVDRQIRILAQLIDAENGNHVWADKFHRDASEIHLVQDELVRTIVSTIGGRVEVANKERSRSLNENELRAYDFYLRATAAEDGNTRADYEKALDLLSRAIEADPGMAQAYHHFSLVRYIQWLAFWVDDREVAFEEALALSTRAVALDPSSSGIQAHHGLLLSNRGDYEQAEHHLTRALDLNPNDSKAHALYGFFQTAAGRPAEALRSFDLAMRLNPLQPNWINWLRGTAYFTARRYRDAIISLSAIPLPMNEVRGWLAAAHAQDGDQARASSYLRLFLDQAKAEMVNPPPEKLSAWHPYWQGAIPYQSPADFEHLLDGLRKAGLRD